MLNKILRKSVDQIKQKQSLLNQQFYNNILFLQQNGQLNVVKSTVIHENRKQKIQNQPIIHEINIESKKSKLSIIRQKKFSLNNEIKNKVNQQEKHNQKYSSIQHIKTSQKLSQKISTQKNSASSSANLPKKNVDSLSSGLKLPKISRFKTSPQQTDQRQYYFLSNSNISKDKKYSIFSQVKYDHKIKNKSRIKQFNDSFINKQRQKNKKLIQLLEKKNQLYNRLANLNRLQHTIQQQDISIQPTVNNQKLNKIKINSINNNSHQIHKNPHQMNNNSHQMNNNSHEFNNPQLGGQQLQKSQIKWLSLIHDSKITCKRFIRHHFQPNQSQVIKSKKAIDFITQIRKRQKQRRAQLSMRSINSRKNDKSLQMKSPPKLQ